MELQIQHLAESNPQCTANIVSMEGIKLKVGDLVNYYSHFNDETKGKICVVAYDYHGYMVLFHQEGCRHRVIESDREYIKYLGNVRTHPNLITDEIRWAQFL